MAIISLRSFEELLESCIYVIQASTDKITDFNIGSITRSYLEAIALLGQYLGSKIEELESAFYIDTAKGIDLDNRLQDLGLPRKIGNKASGLLSVYSYTAPTSAITIPIGTLGKTEKDENGNFLSYVTTEEIVLYSGSSSGIYPYMSSGTSECILPGTIGNTGSQKINQLDIEITGISGIVNISPFTGGTETEIDQDYRARGRLYLQSLSKGTNNALTAAILAISGINNVSLLDWNDVDPTSINAIAPGVLKIILDTDDNRNALVPLVLGTNILTKQIQIDVWNVIKDDVRGAGVAVIFEQTELIPIDIEINVILTPDIDLLQAPTINIGTFKTLFYNKIQTYFTALRVDEDIMWSQILKIGMNISGVIALSSVKLRDTIDNPLPGIVLAFTDITLTNNKKGTLGLITVNGMVIN